MTIAKTPKPVKLSLVTRRRLAAALMTNARRALEEEISKLGRQIAEAALVANFGDDWQKQFDKIPEDWLPSSAYVYVCSPNSTNVYHYSLGKHIPVPNKVAQGSLLLSSEDAKMRRYHELKQRLGKCTTRWPNRGKPPLQQDLLQVLAIIATVEALQAQMPEAYELLKEQEKTGGQPIVTNLPAPEIGPTIKFYRSLIAKEETDVPSN